MALSAIYIVKLTPLPSPQWFSYISGKNVSITVWVNIFEKIHIDIHIETTRNIVLFILYIEFVMKFLMPFQAYRYLRIICKTRNM